jgi:archaeosine synthase
MVHRDGLSERRRIPRLTLRSPEEVLEGLTHNASILDWLNFIGSTYTMPRREVLLVFPCSATKPYLRSRSYKILAHTLSEIDGGATGIHLATISEPFGLVPQEFYGDPLWNYDCPGLFEWWCVKNSVDYDSVTVQRCIDIIGKSVGKFLKRNYRNRFATLIACVRYCSSSLAFRGDHTHRRILQVASATSEVPIRFVPDEEQVRSIVSAKGSFAWDMYGPAHPMAQSHLKSMLEVELYEK